MRSVIPAVCRKSEALSQWGLWVSAGLSLNPIFSLKRA